MSRWDIDDEIFGGNMKNVRSLAAVLIIAAVFSYITWGCANGAEGSFSDARQNNVIDVVSELNEYMALYNENSGYKYSGAVLVAKGNEILLNKGYGMANYEENIPNEPHSVFAIGSLSKSFTAAAIMQLQEKQLLNIDDPISKYIEGHARGDDITIHHLLTHTSGLLRSGLMYGLNGVSLEENIDNIMKYSLLFEPGEGYSYSNAGYNILAAIIEKVSGESYNDYIRDNIFMPLGMNSSRCGIDDSYGDNQSIGYKILTGDPIKLRMFNFSKLIGSGNIYSTVEDLYKYDRALYSDKLLSRESLDKMFTSYSDSNYGYGWGVAERFGHREISHNGHIDGYYSSILRYPDDDYVLIFLTNNSDYTALYEVSETMAAIVFEKDYYIPQKINVVEVNSEVLQKYLGKYEFGEGLSVTITYNGGKLYAKHDDGNIYELLPVSNMDFHYKDHESHRVKFIMDKSNNVVEAKLFGIASVYEGKKVNK